MRETWPLHIVMDHHHDRCASPGLVVRPPHHGTAKTYKACKGGLRDSFLQINAIIHGFSTLIYRWDGLHPAQVGRAVLPLAALVGPGILGTALVITPSGIFGAHILGRVHR